MIEIKGKMIKDECELCGEVLQCELCRDGHGIGRDRCRIAEMVRCQRKHKESREDGRIRSLQGENRQFKDENSQATERSKLR